MGFNGLLIFNVYSVKSERTIKYLIVDILGNVNIKFLSCLGFSALKSPIIIIKCSLLVFEGSLY